MTRYKFKKTHLKTSAIKPSNTIKKPVIKKKLSSEAIINQAIDKLNHGTHSQIESKTTLENKNINKPITNSTDETLESYFFPIEEKSKKEETAQSENDYLVFQKTNPILAPYNHESKIQENTTEKQSLISPSLQPKTNEENPDSIFGILGEKTVRPFYNSEDSDYWNNYQKFVKKHAIPVGEKEVLGAIAGGPIPKKWVPRTGFKGPLLGSKNKWTSVPRALNIPGAKLIGRISVPAVLTAATAVSLYNTGVTVTGYFQAKETIQENVQQN